jgi:hypothetical protein
MTNDLAVVLIRGDRFCVGDAVSVDTWEDAYETAQRMCKEHLDINIETPDPDSDVITCNEEYWENGKRGKDRKAVQIIGIDRN